MQTLQTFIQSFPMRICVRWTSFQSVRSNDTRGRDLRFTVWYKFSHISSLFRRFSSNWWMKMEINLPEYFCSFIEILGLDVCLPRKQKIRSVKLYVTTKFPNCVSWRKWKNLVTSQIYSEEALEREEPQMARHEIALVYKLVVKVEELYIRH